MLVDDRFGLILRPAAVLASDPRFWCWLMIDSDWRTCPNGLAGDESVVKRPHLFLPVVAQSSRPLNRLAHVRPLCLDVNTPVFVKCISNITGLRANQNRERRDDATTAAGLRANQNREQRDDVIRSTTTNRSNRPGKLQMTSFPPITGLENYR